MHRELRNNDVIEEILRRNAARVYRVAYIRLGNRHDAEDVMQDVFLNFVRSSPAFENEEHEKAWFLRCTVNLTKSFFRRAYRSKEVGYEETIAADESDESTRAVAEALMSLPEKLRTVVTLYYYENLSVSDIASITGKSEDSVRSSLKRARERLRELLTDD